VIEGENPLIEGITFATIPEEEEQEPTHTLSPISPPCPIPLMGIKGNLISKQG